MLLRYGALRPPAAAVPTPTAAAARGGVLLAARPTPPQQLLQRRRWLRCRGAAPPDDDASSGARPTIIAQPATTVSLSSGEEVDPYAAVTAALSAADERLQQQQQPKQRPATIDAERDPVAEVASEAAAAAGFPAAAAVPASALIAGDAHAALSVAQEQPQQPSTATRAPHQQQEPATLRHALSRVASLALPLMLQNLGGYSVSIIGAVFIGRLGPLLLSASVLGNSVYNCTGLSVALGLSAGLETLCGQAYGAGNFAALGLLLQRALLVCAAACAPVALLWLGSERLLLAIGQDPAIAALAGRYLVLCVPCLFLSICAECLRKYLQAQREVRPAVAAAALSTAAAPLLFWLFVSRLGLGLDGAALAFVACNALTLVALTVAVARRARAARGDPRRTWDGFKREAWSDWGGYLKYGVPSMAHIALEWWAIEAVILWAGLLPNAELALSTMGLCMSINAYLYMLPLGLASSVNTNVANALGAGDGARARAVVRAGLGLAAALQAALVAALLLGGHHLVGLFCSDATVVARCLGTLPLLACLVAVDGVNATISGILRGSGRQKLGAAVNFAGYWLVGLPASWFLAFPRALGEQGLWGGIIVGAAVQAVVLLAMLARWDWNKEAERVRTRMAKSGGSSGEAGGEGLAFAH